MLTTQALSSAFKGAVGYDDYLRAAPSHEPAWRSFGERITLTGPQQSLIASFSRRINVLCVSGSWCGDCVQQVPILAKIAACRPTPPTARDPQAPGIDFRLLERDTHREFAESVRICGGLRVPVVIFMNEDGEFVGITGDRLLSRYRAIASRQLGAFCPLPGAPLPPDEVAATVADWVEEFERVALLLRLSPKLRERHQD